MLLSTQKIKSLVIPAELLECKAKIADISKPNKVEDSKQLILIIHGMIFNFSYVQYSNVAAKVVRRCLKGDAKSEAAKREVVSVKFTKWEGGKPVGK